MLKIEGCLSGTLGFVLTEVEQGPAVLRGAAPRHGARATPSPIPRDDLSGADVGRKALILGRLLGFAGEPADVAVESLVPAAMQALPPHRVPRPPRRPGRRLVAPRRRRQGQGRHAALRRVGHQEPHLRRPAVVDRSSPFFGLKGTDNQVAFTTARYRKNPLVITGPGAGPAVTAAGVLNDMLRVSG